MIYNLQYIRDAGFEARWTRTRNGAPIIEANDGHGWYVVDGRMWDRAYAVGLRQAFEEFTTLGKFFSIRA